MPNAPVAAAASGLPEITASDFHLSIGREISRTARAMFEDEAEVTMMHATEMPGIGILSSALDHTYDREEAMIRILASVPASSLAGATVQLAAAAKIFAWITMETTPKPEDERAVRRLMTSALTVMVDAAGLEPDTDGITYLADPNLDPWSDAHQRVAELFSANPA